MLAAELRVGFRRGVQPLRRYAPPPLTQGRLRVGFPWGVQPLRRYAPRPPSEGAFGVGCCLGSQEPPGLGKTRPPGNTHLCRLPLTRGSWQAQLRVPPVQTRLKTAALQYTQAFLLTPPQCGSACPCNRPRGRPPEYRLASGCCPARCAPRPRCDRSFWDPAPSAECGGSGHWHGPSPE